MHANSVMALEQSHIDHEANVATTKDPVSRDGCPTAFHQSPWRSYGPCPNGDHKFKQHVRLSERPPLEYVGPKGLVSSTNRLKFETVGLRNAAS